MVSLIKKGKHVKVTKLVGFAKFGALGGDEYII